MKCIYCNTSIEKVMLHRTEPLGQPNAGWACDKCIGKHHPELLKNIKEDGVLDDLNDIFYGNKKQSL